LFLSDSDGEISIKTDAADSIFDVKASDKIQMIELQDETTKVTLTSRIQGVRVLGAWIEDNSGVGVDCMSLRGNSGVSHCDLSVEIAAEMNELLPYDLIVIEYGLNALSAGQTDYSYYGRLMTKVVERIRQCYPECDILMLGVGDRGRKSGATVRSMSTTGAMVSAQRKCARECGVMFWDMREAMGGEDAVVSWREKGLVNADYIHLNHKGGGELAKEFVNSLKMKLNESH
jgi:lysophospholipase L1-like esterase